MTDVDEDVQQFVYTVKSKDLAEHKKTENVLTILNKNPHIIDHTVTWDILKKVNSKGYNFRIPSNKSYNTTILHLAVEHNCGKPVISLLIERGAKVDAMSNCGSRSTPLHKAAKYGRKEIAALLLAHKANIEARDIYGYTPLHIAVIGGNVAVVTLLLENGAEVDAKAKNQWTPLNYLYTSHPGYRINGQNDHKLAKILLDYAANTEIPDVSSGNTSLQYAISAETSLDILKVLLNAGCNIDARHQRQATTIPLVVSSDLESLSPMRCDVVELLLKHGADIHVKDKTGNTPLHNAASQRCESVVKLLIENGANIKDKNEDGRTALELAVLHMAEDSLNHRVDPGPTVQLILKKMLDEDPHASKPYLLEKKSEYWNKEESLQYWNKHKVLEEVSGESESEDEEETTESEDEEETESDSQDEAKPEKVLIEIKSQAGVHGQANQKRMNQDEGPTKKKCKANIHQ